MRDNRDRRGGDRRGGGGFGGGRSFGGGGGRGGFGGGGGRRFDDDKPKPVKVGEEYDVEITDEGAKGDGITKVENFIIFVNGAKKGEHCKIKIKEVARKFAIGEKVGDSDSSESSDAESSEEEGSDESSMSEGSEGSDEE
ncbi:MAG: TRAM domain-containing protein [Candidatus Aenigmarchaeota archaeon]|nr:TRAM domain-containing protein [Candidatus Aenigmarchaeota archaeon]